MIDPNSTFTIDLFALIVMQGPAASTIQNDDEDSEYSDEKSAQSQDSRRTVLSPDLYVLTNYDHWTKTPETIKYAAAAGSFCFVTTKMEWRRSGRSRRFGTLICIVSETTIVSFRTLPYGFPLPTITSPLKNMTLFPFDSWTACLIQFSRFWPQNSSSSNLAQYFFLPLSAIGDNQV